MQSSWFRGPTFWSNAAETLSFSVIQFHFFYRFIANLTNFTKLKDSKITSNWKWIHSNILSKNSVPETGNAQFASKNDHQNLGFRSFYNHCVCKTIKRGIKLAPISIDKRRGGSLNEKLRPILWHTNAFKIKRCGRDLWSKMLIFKREFHKVRVLPHFCPPHSFWPLLRAFKWGAV